MSYNQPPPVQPPFPGQMPPGQPAPARRPKWARKRIAIPAAFVILFVGVGIGSSGSDGTEKTSATTKPEPTATVTKTAAAKAAKEQAAKPAPTVTVTKTVKPKTAKPKADSGDSSADEGSAGEVVFKVWGSAPSGVDINYGSDSDSRSGSGLPMTKTLKLDDEAMYYNVSAQLMGGGDISCSVTVNGETKKGHAAGDYNICSAQLNGGLLGGWS
jgi:hypothetical protein